MGRPESHRNGSSDDTSLELDYSEIDEGLFEKRRETKFLLKLDACLMTWAWLAYLIKVGQGCLKPGKKAHEQANRFIQLQDSLRFGNEGGREYLQRRQADWTDGPDEFSGEPAQLSRHSVPYWLCGIPDSKTSSLFEF